MIMKCIEPKKQNITEIDKEEVQRMFFFMEAILKEKQRRTHNWKIYVAHLADCSLQTL